MTTKPRVCTLTASTGSVGVERLRVDEWGWALRCRKSEQHEHQDSREGIHGYRWANRASTNLNEGLQLDKGHLIRIFARWFTLQLQNDFHVCSAEDGSRENAGVGT